MYRVASFSDGARSSFTRPMNSEPIAAAKKHTAPNVHACWNAASAVSGDGVPMIVTTSATPSAAPTCRATEFSPVALP